jgi:hypothetical protein
MFAITTVTVGVHRTCSDRTVKCMVATLSTAFVGPIVVVAATMTAMFRAMATALVCLRSRLWFSFRRTSLAFFSALSVEYWRERELLFSFTLFQVLLSLYNGMVILLEIGML